MLIFHGSVSRHKTLDINKTSAGSHDGKGIYFSDSIKSVKHYAGPRLYIMDINETAVNMFKTQEDVAKLYDQLEEHVFEKTGINISDHDLIDAIWNDRDAYANADPYAGKWFLENMPKDAKARDIIATIIHYIGETDYHICSLGSELENDVYGLDISVEKYEEVTTAMREFDDMTPAAYRIPNQYSGHEDFYVIKRITPELGFKILMVVDLYKEDDDDDDIYLIRDPKEYDTDFAHAFWTTTGQLVYNSSSKREITYRMDMGGLYKAYELYKNSTGTR